MKKKRVLIGFGLMILVQLATGGLVIMNETSYPPTKAVSRYGVDFGIHIQEYQKKTGFPLLYHYYYVGAPFQIRFSARDEKKKYVSFSLDEVLVELPDGQLLRNECAVEKQFKLSQEVVVMPPDIVETEVLRLSAFTGVKLSHAAPVRVNIKGRLVDSKGHFDAVDLTFSLEPRHSFKIAPYWLIRDVEKNYAT